MVNQLQKREDGEAAWKVERLEDGSPSLRIANAIRDEIDEILSRYDIPHDVHRRDVAIDAACVMLADKALSEIKRRDAEIAELRAKVGR